jgi:mono/diheme cytochrome c family protein
MRRRAAAAVAAAIAVLALGASLGSSAPGAGHPTRTTTGAVERAPVAPVLETDRARAVTRQAIAQTPAPGAVTARRATESPADYQEMVTRYCVSCHNARARVPASAPLELEKASLADPGAHAAVWEKVIRKINVGAMPPQGSPTPGAATLDKFASVLAARLDAAAAERKNPGRYVLHRLNRTEYANAVRDLLGVEIDVAELLPSDGGDFGFDNIAAALTTSPMLLERYLTAALRVAELAVGDRTAEPGTTTHSLSTVVTQRHHVEGLPLGTRGGMKVRHYFPADAEYVFSGRLLRTVAEGYVGVEGHDTPHLFIVTIDGVQVFSASIGGKEDHESSGKNITISREEVDKRMTSAPIRVTAGPHDIGFTFIEQPGQEQNVWQPVLRDSLEAHNPSGLPRLRTGNIQGPYNITGISQTTARQRLFVCTPASAAQERPCATKILSTVARRAFRRPVDDSDLSAPMTFYQAARQEGGDFDAGIRAGLARILASPAFLFRSEKDPAGVPAGTPHRISDLELASRLSFFLWSSIPDDDLLDLAAAGRLRRPAALEAQVKRMLADPRSDALMTNFAGQWLQLRNLDKVTPDLLMFPDFDDNVRQAFRRETELLFTSIVRENRSVLDLLQADYTFVNERLARHYGIRGVYGSRFRRVPVTDANRRGLLGHGSILSLTSAANRTSPILRGKYIISNFLNTPPLPPPADVPQLEASAPKGRPSTVREQLEIHRANPVCASCHRNIDPVGFALENFDAVGRWQQKTREGLAIDAAGVLADGTKVDGPVALRNALLARPDVFAGTVTEKLMIYALGRGLEPVDMPVVRSVLKSAARQNYPMHTIVLGIVQSEPFQMRTKLPPQGRPAVTESAADASAARPEIAGAVAPAGVVPVHHGFESGTSLIAAQTAAKE